MSPRNSTATIQINRKPREILLQVGNGIIQQFGLVAGNAEVDVGINGGKVIRHFAQGSFQLIHALVGLLDDGQCHGPFPVGHGNTRFLFRHDGYFSQVFQLEDTAVLAQIDLADVVERTQQGRELDVVFVVAVAHGHTARFDVVVGQCRFQFLQGDARCLQFVHVRHDLQLPANDAGHIHHGHFGQLFDAAFDDVLGKLAQVEKGGFVVRTFQGQVQTKDRYVGGACLDYARTFHFAWQRTHGSIYLFIDFDESQVGIGTELKAQADHSVSVAGFTLDVFQAGHLHKLLADGFHQGVFQFSGGSVLAGNLYGDFRDGNVGQQRYGNGEVSHQSDDEAGRECHQHRDRTLYQKADHIFSYSTSLTGDSWARLMFPLVMMESPTFTSPSSTSV